MHVLLKNQTNTGMGKLGEKISKRLSTGRKVAFLFGAGGIVKLKMAAVRPGDVGQLLHLCSIMFKQLPVLF